MKRMKNRLVDKAEVLEIVGELYDIFDDYREIQKEIDKIYDKINDLPYIDAIPIEWIRNYVSIWISEPYKNFVLNMIKIWEKENDNKN